ncbi:unnamed protein product [Onchocerca flexuosa]|uniref:DUF2726 domain-containing protein n=1 Tax=Onchocerca flexuosa TaxID=387005 RepID=A0A183HGF5_9BILA|nr:unnamed protein product [Onchocerca flexuosa]
MPICIVAQSDTRTNEFYYLSESLMKSYIADSNNLMLPEYLSVLQKVRKYCHNKNLRAANLINTLEEDIVILFYYHEINASTFVVDTKDEETLRKKFLEWKEKLNFLNSHQTFAFHFTMINGTEPENSEEIFG